MLILGIETSCDETSVALVKDGKEILGVKTFSQIRTHVPFGGVVPEIASRIHVKVIHQLIIKLFSETKILENDIDYIAVTSSPGLIGSLLVGVSFANAYALGLNKPIIPINHLEAHIYSAFLMGEKSPSFPAITLLVSGGHTSLFLMNEIGNYKLLGNTLDDAAGEAFDKTAKLLSLPYPGGPSIDKASKKGNPFTYNFPKGLSKDKENLNFSFSGLKTSVLYQVNGIGSKREKMTLTEENVNNVAASFQRTVIDTLCDKTISAVKAQRASSLIVCGGVAANSELKEKMQVLANEMNIELFIPSLSLCTDNAIMVAGLAYHKTNKAKKSITNIFANDLIGLESVN